MNTKVVAICNIIAMFLHLYGRSILPRWLCRFPFKMKGGTAQQHYKPRYSYVKLVLLIMIGMIASNNELHTGSVATEKHYHQLVIIWVNDSAKFQDYIGKMAPIVRKYGGALDRSFVPSAIWANGLRTPDMVNLVHYDNKEAFEQFKQDSAFRAIVHLRDESTEILSYEGFLEEEDIVEGNEKDREYTIEIVSYRDNSSDLYKKYESTDEGKMREYGFHVEYAMKPESFPKNAPKPDLIKISYFPTIAQKKQFEKDTMHKKIEQELYPNAINSVIWISGKSAN